MIELTRENAPAYLRGRGLLPADVSATAEILAWGVSNQVLRIRPDRGSDLVVKQSRRQLRTKADWFSRLDRIYRETEVMVEIGPLLPAGVVPRVLFEVREDYLFGMEAVDATHSVWKGELLAGRFDRWIAELLGDYLATIHRETCGDARLGEMWRGRQVFDELRIDPFYRRIAQVHTEIGPAVDRLIFETLNNSLCVVLADFSPKNVLIAGDRVSIVDFETGHFGDPAFDLGFFLSHLLLKTVLHAEQRAAVLDLCRAFWNRYRDGLRRTAIGVADLDRRTITNLAACMLAHRREESGRLSFRVAAGNCSGFARRCLLAPPAEVRQVFDTLEGALNV